MPITWRNVAGVDSRGSASLLRNAQDSFDKSVSGLQSIVRQQESVREDNFVNAKKNNTSGFLNDIAAIQDAGEMEQFLASGGMDNLRAKYGPNIDSEAIRGAGRNRLTTLQKQSTADFNFNQSQLQQEAQPIMSQIQQLTEAGDLKGASALMGQHSELLGNIGQLDDLQQGMRLRDEGISDREFLEYGRDRQILDNKRADVQRNAAASLNAAVGQLITAPSQDSAANEERALQQLRAAGIPMSNGLPDWQNLTPEQLTAAESISTQLTGNPARRAADVRRTMSSFLGMEGTNVAQVMDAMSTVQTSGALFDGISPEEQAMAEAQLSSDLTALGAESNNFYNEANIDMTAEIPKILDRAANANSDLKDAMNSSFWSKGRKNEVISQMETIAADGLEVIHPETKESVRIPVTASMLETALRRTDDGGYIGLDTFDIEGALRKHITSSDRNFWNAYDRYAQIKKSEEAYNTRITAGRSTSGEDSLRTTLARGPQAERDRRASARRQAESARLQKILKEQADRNLPTFNPITGLRQK